MGGVALLPLCLHSLHNCYCLCKTIGFGWSGDRMIRGPDGRWFYAGLCIMLRYSVRH